MKNPFISVIDCNFLIVKLRHCSTKCGLGILCFIIATAFFFAGCSGNSDVRPETAVILDLTDRFMPVNSALSGTRFYRYMQVIRKGDRRNAMALVAPVAIRASLHGVSGQMTLEGFATPLFNVGDGVQMNIFLKRSGRLQSISSRYFDPGRNIEDRRWIPIAIPLDAVENDQLEIEISTGPQGDSVADWLALSSMRLVRIGAKQ